MRIIALSIVIFAGAVLAAGVEIAVALSPDPTYRSSLDDLGALVVIAGMLLFIREYFNLQPLNIGRKSVKEKPENETV